MSGSALRHLARLHGIQLGFEDWQGRRRTAPRDSVIAALGALGVDVASEKEAADRVRATELDRWRRPLEPVLVAWDGLLRSVPLRLTEAEAGREVELEVHLEQGTTSAWTAPAEGRAEGSAEVEGSRYVLLATDGPGQLPLGRHRLHASIGGRTVTAWVIAAPGRAPLPERSWGVFAPIPALRSRGSWGAGDFADLATLGAWVARRGGGFVSTLPPLGAFLEEPFEPSPYAPASRLFWNEGLVRPDGSAPAAPDPRDLVDHAAVMRAKRPALDRLAAEADGRDLAAFVEGWPEVEDYARFRAAVERHGAWPVWPRAMREGRIAPGDVDPEVERRFVAAQWAAERQLAYAARQAPLLLDLPLGVHPAAFDTWRHGESFAFGISAGAPPDELAAGGQDWGFPPLHPERTREDGHAYLAACVRHLMRHSTALRVDHVMGLHRLYWVPRGAAPTEGVYVRYPHEELYATLLLEAHRAGAALVGEDLGTVPDIVRETMEERGILRIYVAQTELGESGLPPVPANAQATLNTHDMPTFPSFWAGHDIDRRVELGLAAEEDAADERKRRDRLRETLVATLREEGWLTGPGEERTVIEALLRRLASSEARMLVVSLDDALGEREPHNIPGTTDEYPNWRRRLRTSLEELADDGDLERLLRDIDRLRREAA